MVVRMNWMVLVRKCILLLVIFCLIATISQACHYTEEEEKCHKDEKEEIEVEDEVEPIEESGSRITESKWLVVLDRLIERIIERIFQWIFRYILDLDY